MQMPDHVEAAAEELRAHTWQWVAINATTSCAGDLDEHKYKVGTDFVDHEAHQAHALDAAGMLVSPAHDAAIAARAWNEGCRARADANLYGHGVVNPYERTEEGVPEDLRAPKDDDRTPEKGRDRLLDDARRASAEYRRLAREHGGLPRDASEGS